MYAYLCGQLPFLALCYLVMNGYVLRYFTQALVSLAHGTAPSTLKIPCYDKIERLLCKENRLQSLYISLFTVLVFFILYYNSKFLFWSNIPIAHPGYSSEHFRTNWTILLYYHGHLSWSIFLMPHL